MRAPEYLGPLVNPERSRILRTGAARLQGRDTAKTEILARIWNLCGSSSSMTRAGSAFARKAWNLRTHSEPVRQLQLHDPRGLGL